MKRFTTFVCLAMVLVFALSSFANELPKYHRALDITVEAADFSKAKADTHYLLGGPSHDADYSGTFQTLLGAPAMNGFTTIDYTARTDVTWTASDFMPIAGTRSAWCGVYWPGEDDYGYGNGWNEILAFNATVGNNTVPTTVDLAATLHSDTEGGYDFSFITIYRDAGATDLWSADGIVDFTAAFSETYAPGEYLNGNGVKLAFRLTSDGGWSAEDGSYGGPNGLWVDDISVTVTNDGTVDVYTDDFEAKDLGNWAIEYPVSVGNFAQLWSNLEDDDPCLSNYGPQIAFIDDGLVVPGTGGTLCSDYCYGPGGYTVNTTGGLVGPEATMDNAVLSPVMAWPNQAYNGCYYFFNAYRHETLGVGSPGMFYTWGIRSVDTGDPADMDAAAWGDRNYVYYGGPDYITAGDSGVNDLLAPGRTHVQVRANLYELGAWGHVGNNGSPAPYFDNFRVLAFPFVGPGFSYRELELAQDNFPASGNVDFADLTTNSVRFDMANTISPTDDLFLNPGDSLVINIAPVRAGATIDVMPTIHYVINPNSTFDGIRTLPLTGSYDGDFAIAFPGTEDADTIDGRYVFDLPDEGFLYPGDVIHYYFYAEDNINGGDIQSTTIPRDITEVADFSNPMAYNPDFTVHALPTMTQDGKANSTPEILFWNDFGDRGGEDEWYLAFANLGLVMGVDYDIYYTQAPSSSVSNGIGGRATLSQLNSYGTMLYTCGNLGTTTMSNGDTENDMGADAELVSLWLSGGNNLFATGDELIADLNIAGPTTLLLHEQFMGVNLISLDVRPSIGGQTSPLIKTVAGNAVFNNATEWLAYGGCPGINTFDAVSPINGAVRLAEFTSPDGLTGAYNFSAATLQETYVVGSKVITMPYDFMNIWTNPNAAKAAASLPARSYVLQDVLNYFGVDVHLGAATPAPDATKAFTTRNFPNPFNPSTMIEFTMPRTGHLSLKIYNVRGELVKTLVNEVMEAGEGSKMWDGTNEQGASVSSGVYFYEARTDSDVKVQKMALVK